MYGVENELIPALFCCSLTMTDDGVAETAIGKRVNGSKDTFMFIDLLGT